MDAKRDPIAFVPDDDVNGLPGLPVLDGIVNQIGRDFGQTNSIPEAVAVAFRSVVNLCVWMRSLHVANYVATDPFEVGEFVV